MWEEDCENAGESQNLPFRVPRDSINPSVRLVVLNLCDNQKSERGAFGVGVMI